MTLNHLPEQEMHWIGIDPPRVDHQVITEQEGWNWHNRMKAAREFDIPLKDVADHPDHLPVDDSGWDDDKDHY